HISCIFIIKIIKDLNLEKEINIDSIIKIIEHEYEVEYPTDNSGINIHNLFTSIISSCPIDADRMDYLLRDSYFSGVKYGIYDYSRLLMSIVPFEENNKVHLAFKESGLDPLIEFINARSNLFSQVYFHKTNRFFSAALKKSCRDVESEIVKIDDKKTIIESLQSFYLKNSDNYFLDETLSKELVKEKNAETRKYLIESIINRDIWKKIFEKKYIFSNVDLRINDVNKFSVFIEEKISELMELENYSSNDFIIDIVSENNFKDIEKSRAKLLKKQSDDSYELKDFLTSKEVLQPHHRIRYFIRVYTSKRIGDSLKEIKEKLKTTSLIMDEKHNEISSSIM
ncbi:phosphohydrolase, partial [Serratia plymuthica]|uniref:phosphohydrolase n=1 Tax=Serratia plymuthica TaxID=82996 RepID=UPI001926E3F9